jgi:hypothetical protein
MHHPLSDEYIGVGYHTQQVVGGPEPVQAIGHGLRPL